MNIGEIVFWTLCAVVVASAGVAIGVSLDASIRVANADDNWWAWYNAYLQSVDWKIKRKAVLLRCGGRCERCGNCRPIDVHHLPGSYARIPHELPWDLAALCYDCHKAQHPGKRF